MLAKCSILTVTFLTMAQAVPNGCPLLAPPPADSVERGRLTTTAQAGAATAAVGETVALSGAVAEDDASVTYQWVQTFGPGVAIIDGDRADASFVAGSYGREETLTFLVLTRNEGGEVGRAEVSVTVAADPNFGMTEGPVARAGGDREVATGSTVTLDGSGSSGGELTFSWRQVSGTTVTLTNATLARASFTAPPLASGDANANEYVFELTVRDDMARVSTDRVTITVVEQDPGTDPTGKPRVRMTIIRDEGTVTTLGDIVLELEPDLAPITVENFLQYVDDGFYDGLLIHRVIPDFVIQGGGHLPDLSRVEPRDPIESEADNGLSNVRGTISMALVGTDADSATSQWFINLSDNSADLDAPAVPPFTVFGRVVEGMDVVDAIAAIPTATKGFPPNTLDNVPLPDIIMESVRRDASSGAQP